MASESRKLAMTWWNSLDSSCQGMHVTNHFFDRKPHTLTGSEIEVIWRNEGNPKETQYIYRPESKIEKDKITIYGAGKFNEEKLILNKTEAAMLLIELHKFINQE